MKDGAGLLNLPDVTEIVPVEKKISLGLEAFDKKKKELQEMAEASKSLTVADIHDKKQLEVVSTARKALKAERVSIEKQGKELRDNINVMTKNVSAKEKELVALIEPTEAALLAEEKRVADALEFERTEAERKEKAMIQARVKQLLDNGCSFDGVNYTIADISINDVQLKVMSDGIFETFMVGVKQENDRIKQAAEIAEQERLAELARIEEAKKAEELRIKKESEELAAKQKAFAEQQEAARKEQEAAQAKIKAENDRIAKEQADKQAELDRRAKAIQDAKDAADRAERERLLQIENDRIAQEKETMRIEAERLAAIEAENKRIQDEKDRIEAERIENERQAALAPDKKKLETLADTLSTFELPTMTTDAGKVILDEVVVLLQKINAHIAKKVKAL